ncbi:hypothetical protein HHI36_011604 [Cryptolaemus montrouzieri]|uniref:Organic solute transporter alpha-like protein n=1 Tax=Cryptolaemus montrouzieri TaxID=559131 RepID=A0ABD2MM55_9CUCU
MDTEVIAENISRCASDNIPSISSYMSATNIYGISLVSIGSVAVLTVIITFLDTLKYIMRNSSSRVKADSAFVIGVYPVIAVATFFVILVPRAHLLAEALTQGMFMAGMYQLWCLFVGYCGGEAELVQKLKPGTLTLKVGPCCCWPCCICLPNLNVDKKTLHYLRLVVLQLPIVQGFVYIILLVMWAERESLYQVNYMYLQPIIILSILLGIWGMLMTINFLKSVLEDEFLLSQKFLVLQTVLIFAKLQGLITRILVWTNVLPCKPPITPAVYGNLIHNTLMLGEMVLLGFIARNLYKRELPVNNLKLKQITTVSTMTNLDNTESNRPKDRVLLPTKGHINKAADISV